MTADEYRANKPRDPSHPDHQKAWPTAFCTMASQVIECDETTDTRRCIVCGKEWKDECNCYDDMA